MSLPAIVEVAIGLGFVYFATSALCSGVNEMLAERAGRRGRFLREGLLNLIGARWTYLRIIYHPLVASLYRDAPGKLRHPSYIPGGVFATAAFETVVLKATLLTDPGPAPSAPVPAPPMTYAQVRAALVACDEAGDYLAAALLPIVDGTNGNLDLATRQVAGWYEASMERVSGWYKRRSRWLLFVIGLMVAVVCNVDSIHIATALSRSAALRGAVSKVATEAVETGKVGGVSVDALTQPGTTQTIGPFERVKVVSGKLAELEPIGLPVGFSCLTTLDPNSTTSAWRSVLSACFEGLRDESGPGMLRRLIGWVLTAFAVSLGAPFWFDLLNRLVDLRGSGKKPPERSTTAAPRF